MKNPTCDRCGARLPRSADAATVAAHHTSALCVTGAARRQAEAAGLLPVLHFETVLSITLHTSFDTMMTKRADLLRACGVQVTEVQTRLKGMTADAFDVIAEPWAPLWAVALLFGGGAHVRTVLRRAVNDPTMQQAVEALVRVTMHSAVTDSRTDLCGLLRDFIEGVRP